MAPLPRHSFEYVQSLVQREDTPLRQLQNWNPFRIDALGLVTLLGAEEVNKCIGTLQRRRFTEWLPLLAAFIVAGDRFTDEQPGYSLYNLTDGIQTTELKGWFTRWISSQDIRNSTTIFRWKHTAGEKYHYQKEAVAPLVALLVVIPLLVCTVLMGDWFGVGNTLAIILSILVRKALLWQRRTALNTIALPSKVDALPMHNRPQERDTKRVDTFTRQLHRLSSQPSPDEVVTMFVTRADGRMATIYAPRNILSTFIRTAPLPSRLVYHTTQWIGWTAFGAHIIVLGMSSLFAQIYTVILLVLSTWAMCHDFAFDNGREYVGKSQHDLTDSEFINVPLTSRIFVEQENPPAHSPTGENIDKRMYAYVCVMPTDKQESMLKHWSMLPFDGVPWYAEYERVKEAHVQTLKLKSTSTKKHFLGSPASSNGSGSTVEAWSYPSSSPQVASQ